MQITFHFLWLKCTLVMIFKTNIPENLFNEGWFPRKWSQVFLTWIWFISMIYTSRGDVIKGRLSKIWKVVHYKFTNHFLRSGKCVNHAHKLKQVYLIHTFTISFAVQKALIRSWVTCFHRRPMAFNFLGKVQYLYIIFCGLPFTQCSSLEFDEHFFRINNNHIFHVLGIP